MQLKGRFYFYFIVICFCEFSSHGYEKTFSNQILTERSHDWWALEGLTKEEATQRIYRRESNNQDIDFDSETDQPSILLTNNDYDNVCENVTSFTARQKEICRNRGGETLLNIIAEGAQMAIDECRNQMKNNHWNCTHHKLGDTDALFGPTTQINTKEKAFIYALTSAALTSQISRACAKAQLTDCGCDTQIGQGHSDNYFSTTRMEGSNSATSTQITSQPSNNLQDEYNRRMNRQAEYRPKNHNFVSIQRNRRSTEELGYQSYLSQIPNGGYQPQIPNAWSNRFSIGNKIVIRGSMPLNPNINQGQIRLNEQDQIPFEGAWSWNGCSHDLREGRRFSRQFLDLDDRPDTVEGFMNRWNNRAGRAATHKSMERVCKCHGTSGSCAIKTCWRQVPDFGKIGNLLLEKYKDAIKIKIQGSSPLVVPDSIRRQRSIKRRKIRELQNPVPFEMGTRNPNKEDLIYVEDSPDYCEFNPQVGSLGTRNRECSPNEMDDNSCTKLCCRRGFRTEQIQIEKKCGCKFFWCCRVECKTCLSEVLKHYCL